MDAAGGPVTRQRHRPPWPFPGPATPTDRSRTIALGYRSLALEFAAQLDALIPEKVKERVDQFDQVAVNLGEVWVRPTLTTGDDRVERSEFAALAHVAPDTVSSWTTRPPSWGACPARGPDGKYSRVEVIEFLYARDLAHSAGGPPAPAPEEHAWTRT